MLKFIVLLGLVNSLQGKYVRIQMEFEDMLKLMKENIASDDNIFRKSKKDKSFVISDEPETQEEPRRYNNPYHPEDDAKTEENTTPTPSDASHDLSEMDTALNGIPKSDDIEKDNKNFVDKGQDVSDDDLNDMFDQVYSKLPAKELEKTTESVKAGSVKEDNADNEWERARESDKKDFRYMQRRFILKGPPNKSADI